MIHHINVLQYFDPARFITLQLAGYKVKCMLAEPKGKRGRADSGGGSLDNGPTWGQVPAHFAPLMAAFKHTRPPAAAWHCSCSSLCSGLQ